MRAYRDILLVILSHAFMLWCWEQPSFLLFWASAFWACWITFYGLEEKLCFRKRLWLFLCLAFLYSWQEPDDDIFRYLLEGEMLLQGINPYMVAPAELTWSIHYLSEVNHPEWTAIYGPLYLEMMAMLMSLGFGVLSLKLFWLALHVFNAWLLSRIVSQQVMYIYLFSPFVLFETIAQAHLEQVLVTGVLLMIYASKYHKSTLMSFGILLSCWVKWWLLPALPLIIRKSNLKALALALVLSVCIFIPFQGEFTGMQKSLFDFKEMWSCGYPYFWLSEIVGLSATKVIVFIFLLGIGCSVLLFGGHLSEQIWQLFRWSLFFAPTLHPWYFVFPLAAALCSNKKTTFFVIGVLVLGLHHPEFSWRAGEGWQSYWLYCLPLFLALFCSEWRLRHHFFMQKGETVEQFTVVTPVLNEAQNLHELGRQICLMSDSIQEWIVVDAGSDDESVQVAKTYGAEVLCPGIRGRGPQICHALEKVKNDWVIVIHADTRLPMDFFKCLKYHISRVPNLDGGAFKMAYRGYQHMGPLHLINDLKFRLFGVSFGDQSQFFHLQRLKSRGNFPKLALMEDLELSLIWKGGHVAYISETKSFTSPRRWKKVGRLRNTLQILSLLCNYLLQRHWNPPVDVKKLYQRYYA